MKTLSILFAILQISTTGGVKSSFNSILSDYGVPAIAFCIIISAVYGVVSYLRHEDKEQIEQDRPTEPFFSLDIDFVSATEVISSLDGNKAKLGRNKAKFFVLTIRR